MSAVAYDNQEIRTRTSMHRINVVRLPIIVARRIQQSVVRKFKRIKLRSASLHYQDRLATPNKDAHFAFAK
jgi:hypothetical protein